MHNSLPRRIIVLAGSREWAFARVAIWLAEHASDDVVWLGDVLPEGLALQLLARREQLLGDEFGVAVIDGWAGFDPEQFGVVSGTVRGGGLLLLLLPPPEVWLSYPDPAQQRIAVWPHTPETLPNRFIARALRILRATPAVEWFDEPSPLPDALPIAPRSNAHPVLRSADQQQAIAAVQQVAKGHRRRPLVVLADRGRGKSSALGIAAAEQLRDGLQKIIVTAPHPNAVNSLFAHAATELPGASRDANTLTLGNGQLAFVPPDELLRTAHACELLLVDEAAAIPTPLLEQLVQRYHRIAFATTVHGYEGTGRGFAVRFFKVLERQTPGWRKLEMHEPIRWCDGDPLEQLAGELLLLAAEPAGDAAVVGATAQSCRYQQITADALMHDDQRLVELFGLLVLAHYRTSPLDLRQLLDSPNVTVHLLLHDGHVLATALTLREGGFDSELAEAIYLGRRRPRGHLAPQALAFYCGMAEAPLLTTERIMRIAVHPAVQQRGIGSRLLQQLTAAAMQEGGDYLSASFGATTELLHFWRRGALLPVRIGMAREASSGSHSALVMRPFTPAALALFARARQRFLNYLPLQLSEPLRELEPALVTMLLAGEMVETSAELDEDDWMDLHSFAHGKRGYEVCMGAIHKLARQVLHNPLWQESLTELQRALLISKVVQHHPWPEVVVRYHLKGEAGALDALREVIKALLKEHAPQSGPYA